MVALIMDGDIKKRDTIEKTQTCFPTILTLIYLPLQIRYYSGRRKHLKVKGDHYILLKAET
jgi:hypothetical protein